MNFDKIYPLSRTGPAGSAICRTSALATDSVRQPDDGRVSRIVPVRAGKRTAQRYTYSPSFPRLNYNETKPLFFAKLLDSGRPAISWSPDETGAGPPVDTQEQPPYRIRLHAFRLQTAVYKSFFIEYGAMP